MKKVISYFLFVLIIALFVYELYFSIVGSIDVNNQFAELAAREASGHEYLGVGVDILCFGLIFISFVGFILSLISRKIAQNRFVRISSAAMCLLFFLPPCVSYCIFAS